MMNGGAWTRSGGACSPSFLLRVRDGTLGDDVFGRWMQQDRWFVAEGVRFLAALLARAPERHRDLLATTIDAYRQELRLFEEEAGKASLTLAGVRPGFVNHAYTHFLLATAYGGTYAEAFTALYVAERAYHDSWRVVRAGVRQGFRWHRFVENWAGDAFAAFVARLESELDGLAAAAAEEERRAMAEVFELTTRYEIAFWDMALEGATWPGD